MWATSRGADDDRRRDRLRVAYKRRLDAQRRQPVDAEPRPQSYPQHVIGRARQFEKYLAGEDEDSVTSRNP
jgi:hypothetical protein